MQRSTQLTVAGILIIVASCLALVSSLFIGFFTWLNYFVPYHYGTRVIDAPFYFLLAIICFELSAFILGLVSSKSNLRQKSYWISTLGATSVLIAGLLFFVSFLIKPFLPYLMDFTAYVWWSILQLYCGLPIVILASISMIILVTRKLDFKSNECNLSLTSGIIMILCSIVSVLFAVFSYISYVGANGQFLGSYPFYTFIVSIGTLLFALPAGILLLRRRSISLSIKLVILTLISALSLSIIFEVVVYPWTGVFVMGLNIELPIILLSAVALTLAYLGQRKKNQTTPKSIDVQVNVS
jgi:hypothetical protein